MAKPVISIITVVYNSCEFIERTILSVLGQSYTECEYIIIDGGSTDGTIEIIKKYQHRISYWASEPDRGLYDAMNKGIQKAGGEYVWFINSGDQIFSKDTLSIIFDEKSPLADVYYGETIIINKDGEIIGDRRLKAPEKLTWKSFKKGMLVSHQSIIVRKAIAPLYDPTFRFSADVDWVISALKKALKIENTNMVLSLFMDGGLTNRNRLPGLKERFVVMKKHYGLFITLLSHVYILLRFPFHLIKYRRI